MERGPGAEEEGGRRAAGGPPGICPPCRVGSGTPQGFQVGSQIVSLGGMVVMPPLFTYTRTHSPQLAEPLPCRFLGTSGQNVSDIFRYSSMEDHLEILEWTLRVRHISPTAPDTLGICSATLVGPRSWGGFPAQPCIQKRCFGNHPAMLILFMASACTIQTRGIQLLPPQSTFVTVGSAVGIQ